MDENNHFSLVFAKLRSILEEGHAEPGSGEVFIPRASEVTQEELDEIENLRRIVLEVTEPVQMSFTTT